MERLTRKDITDARIFRISDYIKEEIAINTEHELKDGADRSYMPEGFEGYSLKTYISNTVGAVDKPSIMTANIMVSEDGTDVILAPIKDAGYPEDMMDDMIQILHIK